MHAGGLGLAFINIFKTQCKIIRQITPTWVQYNLKNAALINVLYSLCLSYKDISYTVQDINNIEYFIVEWHAVVINDWQEGHTA